VVSTNYIIGVLYTAADTEVLPHKLLFSFSLFFFVVVCFCCCYFLCSIMWQ